MPINLWLRYSTCQFRGIEKRAQRISDPVERLRYLRKSTAVLKASSWAFALTASVAILIVTAVTGLHALSSAPVTPNASAPSVRFPDAASGIDRDAPAIWPVEQTSEYDLYSNGLRVENRLIISNHPRAYTLIDAKTGTAGPRRFQPAGIVFHMTESDQVPFESGQRSVIKRIGLDLLAYVRNKRAYHFLIDRFGRVHRIVAEQDTANHAGNSVWADSKWIYLDLNTSFVGVAIEGRTKDGEELINGPQLHAAKTLTEMLRGKYNIPAADCITHAQVSVNPRNMQLGWHTDLGAGFPFKQIGLPDNYQIPSPALYLFGFDYSATYRKSIDSELEKSLALAEGQRREAAAQRSMTLTAYRRMLQQEYNDMRSAVRGGIEDEEK